MLGESESIGIRAARSGTGPPACRWLCSAGGVADLGSMAIAVAEPRLATSDLKVQAMLHTFSASLLRLVVDRNAMRRRLGGIQLNTRAVRKMDATGDR